MMTRSSIRGLWVLAALLTVVLVGVWLTGSNSPLHSENEDSRAALSVDEESGSGDSILAASGDLLLTPPNVRPERPRRKGGKRQPTTSNDGDAPRHLSPLDRPVPSSH